MSNYICNIRCSYRQPSGYCGRTGGYETCQYRQLHVDAKPFGSGLDVCSVCGKPSTIGKPQTNADRIRAMTDEEIENWFWWMHKEMMRYIDSRVFLHDWLKQEADNGKD